MDGKEEEEEAAVLLEWSEAKSNSFCHGAKECKRKSEYSLSVGSVTGWYQGCKVRDCRINAQTQPAALQLPGIEAASNCPWK